MYSILQEIIAKAEQYEKEVPPDVRHYDHFVRWLAEFDRRRKLPAEGQPIDVQISVLLGFLSKYAKYHSKPALEKHGLATIDEFVFMASLMQQPNQSKSELMGRNVTETPTGSEIIRRLVRKKIVQEKMNPDDKRAKLLTLTEQGRGIFFGIVEDMQKVARTVAGNLTNDEKNTLVTILRKLDAFHRDEYFHKYL